MAAYLLAAALDEAEDNRKYKRLGDFTDRQLHTNTRLDRNCFLYLLEILHGDLARENGRNFAVPTDTQLMVGLHVLATGSTQSTVGGFYGVAQSTTSDITRRLVLALNRIAVDNIKFPTTVAELDATKRDFYRYGGVRNVIGIIDCTHVFFTPLRVEEAGYVDRKLRHSVNAQLVCDASLKITDVVARWPGGVHDSFIWSDCGLREEVMQLDGWLLGDSGYPLEPWLLTGFQNPATHAEEHFNASVAKTRNLIEIVNGILKIRWRILSQPGGEMLYRVGRVCDIIVACCVLHNICMDRRVHLGDIARQLPADVGFQYAVDEDDIVPRLRDLAVEIRNQLVQDDFVN